MHSVQQKVMLVVISCNCCESSFKMCSLIDIHPGQVILSHLEWDERADTTVSQNQNWTKGREWYRVEVSSRQRYYYCEIWYHDVSWLSSVWCTIIWHSMKAKTEWKAESCWLWMWYMCTIQPATRSRLWCQPTDTGRYSSAWSC